MSRLPRGPASLAATFAVRGSGGEFVLGDAVSVTDCRGDPSLVLELIRAFQAGRRGADELLIAVYAPHIATCLRRYRHFYERDLDDLFQEGRLAVLDACARWDFDRGTASPASYVFKYIRGYIHRYAVTFESCVRVPVHAYDRSASGKTRRSAWLHEFQKTLSHAPICPLFTEFEERASPTGSWIATADPDEEAGPLEDLLFDQAQDRTDDLLASADLAAALRDCTLAVTASLDDRQRDVLARRLGPDGTEETLLEIGQDYGVSRERIRQIEHIALRTCRKRAKAMGCATVDFDCFRDWAAALVERVRGLGREPAECGDRARSSTGETEAA